MNRNELHARLDALGQKIAATKKQLHDRKSWNDGHRLSAGELEARYKFLKSELDGEVQDLEAHGHHVSGLEKSFLSWFESLDETTRST